MPTPIYGGPCTSLPLPSATARHRRPDSGPYNYTSTALSAESSEVIHPNKRMSSFRSFNCILYFSKPSSASRFLQNAIAQRRAFTSMVMRPAPAPESVAKEVAASIHQPRDPNTLANYNAWRTKHTTADFEIDFEAKRLKGTVHLTLERLAKNERKVILDTR